MQEKNFPAILITIIKNNNVGGIVLKNVGSIFTTAYLLLMFGIYPFFMDQGYVNIGDSKYRFFIYCSLGALAILSLIGVIYVLQVVSQRYKEKEAYLINWDNLSITGLFVLLYATEIFISYTLSDYRQEALWGTEGWNIGLILLLALCGLYFWLSLFWDGKSYIWYVCMAASAMVFILGILDRFSVYLLPLEVRDPAFISTLGNINWFCGYLSVLSPIGISIFLFHSPTGAKRWISGIYIGIAFIAGFCQGSSSVMLFWGALFFIILWISTARKSWLVDCFLLVSFWGFSAQAVRIMRILAPDGYNYDTNSLCAQLTDSSITFWVGVISFGIYLLLKLKSHKWEEIDSEMQILIRRLITGLLAGAVLIWLFLAGVNTWIGIPGFEKYSSLLLNHSWGNGRGATWQAGINAFREMTFIHKLFGVGPDCFSSYVYSLPDVAAMLRENFGGSRLTNAHNELLTGLVNTGIFGICFYLGIFLSLIGRCMKTAKDNPALFLYVVCLFCYLAHNMVSFAQVLNLPFAFLLIAMGEKELKMYRKKEINIDNKTQCF